MTLTYNEFFLWLDELASSKGVKLSFTTKDFFFNLVHYCEKNGEFDYETGKYVVEGTVRAFNGLSAFNSTRKVQEAVASLSELGVIETVSQAPSPTRFYIDFPYVELVQKGVV